MIDYKPFLINTILLKEGLPEGTTTFYRFALCTVNTCLSHYLSHAFEIVNDYYINIVENTSSKKPSSIANANSTDDDREIVRLILDKYKDRPSFLAIVQDHENTFQSFSFNEVTARDVWLQLKMLNGGKSTGVD